MCSSCIFIAIALLVAICSFWAGVNGGYNCCLVSVVGADGVGIFVSFGDGVDGIGVVVGGGCCCRSSG